MCIMELVRKRWGGLSLFLYPLILLCGLSNQPRLGHAEDRVSTAAPSKPSVLGHRENLYDVCTVGEQHVWVVGYFVAVFHSQDAGKSWLRKDAGTTNSFLGVSFANEEEGWIVGENGTILHTKDSGESWERQENPVPEERLLKVQFISERQGWAVGTFGLILHTMDGGLRWQRQPFEEDVVLNDLYFLDASEGWAAGEYETILHTVDGGETWEKQHGEDLDYGFGEEPGRFFGISFENDRHGIAVGTQGLLVTADDGGETWIKRKPLDDTLLKVRFFGDGQAIVVGLRGCITRTENYGHNWSTFCLLHHHTWLCGVAFTGNGSGGYLVGDLGKILVTRDRGRTWIPYYELSR